MSDARPFLKWAGGKTKLLPELLARVPSFFDTYYEPFLGGGTLFFALQAQSFRPRFKAVLSDVNPDLVRSYIAVRDEVDKVVRLLKKHRLMHEKHGAIHYQVVRNLDSNHMSGADCAARMIYLNKTCFNGLWRVNKSGRFNVPMGKFKSPPTICDEDNLRVCSAALANTEILCCPFHHQLIPDHIERGAFVYLDPPYVPLSETSNFSSYTKEGFGQSDQLSLSHAVRNLKDKRVPFLLSNSGSAEVRKLYKNFKIEEVLMRRNINSKAGSRGPVVEYLISGGDR